MDNLFWLLQRCVALLLIAACVALTTLGLAAVAAHALPELAQALSVFVLTPGGLVATMLLWLWLRKRR